MKLSHIAASIALIAAAGAAQAAGGLTLGGVSGSGASTTFSITQGGNTQTVNMGTTHVNAFTLPGGTTLTETVTNGTSTKSSYTSTIGFDSTNWEVTGNLTFNAGTKTAGTTLSGTTGSATDIQAFDYVSAANVATFVAGVGTAINNAITAEVAYINGQVTTLSASVTAYNDVGYVHLTEADADASTEGAKVKTDLAALNAEVTTTKPVVTKLRAITYDTATSLATTSVVIDATGTVAKNFAGTDGTAIVKGAN